MRTETSVTDVVLDVDDELIRQVFRSELILRNRRLPPQRADRSDRISLRSRHRDAVHVQLPLRRHSERGHDRVEDQSVRVLEKHDPLYRKDLSRGGLPCGRVPRLASYPAVDDALLE